MASQLRQPSPPGPLHPHHGPPGAHPQMNGHIPMQPHATKITPQHMSQLNEAVWLQIGNLTELMGDLDGAIMAYEQALRHNQYCITAMNAISCILRTKENFPKAVEYLQAIVKLEANNGEVWGSLGHCYLMMEDLQQAYSAYQQALYYLRDPKEPKLWYGIGILYDRYGSLEHAEEAFSQVMRMQPDFEKANEIYFRLGIIYKQQQKFGQSLECFTYIVHDPPRPLTEEDIWFQIGHVHEQQKDYDSAKSAYRRVLDRDPNHAKVLQQLGWLHHQQSNSFHSQEQAIEYLEKSVSSDNSDAQSWYLLGRCYMSQQKFSKAYEAYQQAVYRDGRNPTFWCSIGVLYYQINQYRDALDAYSRAIRLNPYISEVWYDLGTLYESCSNQTNDALDAYQRAADLDPTNVHIKARLQLLRNGQSTGMPNQHAAPVPQDIHPQHYQAANVAGPPGVQWGVQAPPSGPPGQIPAAPGPSSNWDRRLAAIDNPQQQQQQQQQQPIEYGPRDAIRPPPQQRQPSPGPRVDQIRSYEQHRHTPVRRPSPPPNMNHIGPTSYPTPQALPQPPPLQAQQTAPPRITNPNYGAPGAGIPPPPPQNGIIGGQGLIPPIGRGNSPPPEIRPITDDRMTSPGGGYPHQPYQHHANTSNPGGIAQGAPPPAAALAAAEAAAARDRDDRPSASTGFKRVMESEDDYKMSNKKPANGDNRGRLEDHHYRRGSPTERPASPRERMQRRSSSEIRREDQLRANENYHPSEAAHHPQILPSIHAPPEQQQQQQHQQQQQPQQPQQQQQQQQQQHLPPMAEVARDERREAFEPAARKMDMDEDYNDEIEDDKRMAGSGGHNSPQQRGPPMMNGQPKVEPTS